MGTCVVYVTVGSREEARSIARDLVDRRLASSVNMIAGAKSIYRWQGEVREAEEVVMFAKTQTDLVAAVTERIDALHSYDVPCVIALPIDAGHPDYLDWIEAETAESEVGG